MPRRAAARAQVDQEPPAALSGIADAKETDTLKELRTQWKWAAFSQFFFTFNHLFAMNDVSLADIEDDLTHGSNIVLPRIMQRLLYTLSYDRKVSLDNWQTALRKQYRKRDPAGNPIGPEPRVEDPDEPSSSPVPEDAPTEEAPPDGAALPEDGAAPESTRASTLERGLSVDVTSKALSMQPSEPESEGPPPLSLSAEQEESKDWRDLPMLTKLTSLHSLAEWQFHNPTRLRTLMRNDDDTATWRIEPIGYDAKKNAYWLIGADRLWLQRPLPKPPRSAAASLKRKRTTAKPAPKTKARAAPAPAKRQRLQTQETTSSGRGRAAKTQAKARLDAQAVELAALNREAAARAKREATSGGTQARGTRLSARLRGRGEEEEWQAVPEEWLGGAGSSKVNGNNGRGQRGAKGKAAVKVESENKKTGLESDGSEISELTELSEESEKGHQQEEGEQEDEQEDGSVKKEEDVKPPAEEPAVPVDDRGLEEQLALPEGFIEWETICVTLHEWEHIAERFEKGTHYTEKALYKVLVNDIVPVITEELREIERKQRLTVALTQRKRSSRLLLRQSEREEAEAAARKVAEEEERNSRAKRQEARAKKEEADRERRETARELRRREREEKEAKEQAANGDDGGDGSQMLVDIGGNESAVAFAADPSRLATAGSSTSHYKTSNGNGNGVKKAGTGSGSRTPIGEDWELDCEICHRRGINLDDGTPMMSCGLCSRWQHIACHDRADKQAGRRQRNWDLVEFVCLQCRSKQAVRPHGGVESGSGGVQPYQGQQGPYMGRAGVTSYGANPYMAPPPQSQYPAPVNGSGSPYAREHQSSNSRSTSSHAQQQQYPRPAPSQQQYAAPIAFSHYQPQQRGFSSNAEQAPYGASSHTQPYGQQYMPYPPANGSGHPPYQQTPQRWSAGHVTGNGTPGPIPTPIAYSTNASSGPARLGHPAAPSTTHYPQASWQPPPHVPQTQIPVQANFPPHADIQQQRVSQFRYHPSSYQPAPS